MGRLVCAFIIYYLVISIGCGRSPAFKYAGVGIVADLTTTEIALAQPGLEEGNVLVENRGVRLGLNVLLIWGLYEWDKRTDAEWVNWWIGTLRFIVAGTNSYLIMRND